MDTTALDAALVHVAGPIETEAVDSPLGFVYVQRCLVCDAVVRRWGDRPDPPDVTLPIGSPVALDESGDALFLEANGIRLDERRCVPTPFVDL